MDGSVHISDIETIWLSDTYADTMKSEYKYIWRRIARGSSDIYTTNKENKIVLCREMFDLARRIPLGYIVIGISQQYYQELMENVIQNGSGGVLVLGADGNELSRYGKIDKKAEEYLKEITFTDDEYNCKGMCFSYGSYEFLCKQIGEHGGIVCKIMPKYSVWMQLKKACICL